MLLQSHRGLIRVFPAVPRSWRDISFANLRARGAFSVSARMSDGHVDRIHIKSEKGGPVTLHTPWPNRPRILRGRSDQPANFRGDTIEVATNANATYLLHP
jgi:hypothetical protein